MIIDTKAIDAYRQGVEIRQFKDYDAGLAKIHAAEQGHVLKRNRCGEDRHYRVSEVYVDAEVLDPVERVRGVSSNNLINTDFLDGRVEDGVLEPLTIRSVARRDTLLSDREPHQTYGGMMGGTELVYGAAPQIVNIENFAKGKSGTKFNDCIQYSLGIPTSHVKESLGTLAPFVDVAVELELDTPNAVSWRAADQSNKLLSLLSRMAGCRDNGYVSLGKVSSPAGWVYDGTAGTDSIAFGGMAH